VLGAVVIAQHDGQSVRLKDVANVVEAPEPKFGDAMVMGPRRVADDVRQYGRTPWKSPSSGGSVDEMKKTFNDEGITLYPRLYRRRPSSRRDWQRQKFFVARQCFGGAGVGPFSFGFAHGIHFIHGDSAVAAHARDYSSIILESRLHDDTADLLRHWGGVDDAIIDVENIFAAGTGWRARTRNTPHPDPLPLGGGEESIGIATKGGLAISPKRSGRFSLPPAKRGRGSGEGATAWNSRAFSRSCSTRRWKSAAQWFTRTFIVAPYLWPVLMMSGLQGRFFAPTGQLRSFWPFSRR